MSKFDPKIISPIASGKSQVIKFIHSAPFREDMECRFYTTINKLTGDRMSAFNNDPPFINEHEEQIKYRILRLRKDVNVKIISDEGDFDPV